MFALLPELHKKELYREYRLRLFTIFLCLVSAGIVIDVFLFLPSYIFVSSEKKNLIVEGEGFEKIITEKNETGIADTLSVIRAAMTVLSKEESSQTYDALLKVASLLPEGVSLTGLTYNAGIEGSSSLVLQGEADVRKNAILFTDQLKADPMFTSVVLPISDLAKDVDLTFHITAEGNF